MYVIVCVLVIYSQNVISCLVCLARKNEKLSYMFRILYRTSSSKCLLNGQVLRRQSAGLAGGSVPGVPGGRRDARGWFPGLFFIRPGEGVALK